MTTVASQVEVHTPFDAGPVLQVALKPADINLATTVPAGQSVTSQLIPASGYKVLAFAVKSTQAGNITIQRYLDAAGTIPQGAALTTAITANTDTVLNNNDNHPFQSFTVQVSNSGASDATLTDTLLLLQAN